MICCSRFPECVLFLPSCVWTKLTNVEMSLHRRTMQMWARNEAMQLLLEADVQKSSFIDSEKNSRKT